MTFTDQLNRRIKLKNFPPKSIISVVPSQTELLFDLGLDKEIVGLSWFCVHPAEKVKSKTKIGGTKNLKIDKIASLNPDLIIANKEENEKKSIDELSERFPVWISDVKNMDSALDMIRKVGQITSKEKESLKISDEIQKNFSELKKFQKKLKVLYLIWRKPYMSVGNDTFINEMLQICGFENVCNSKSRYPELNFEEIKELNPDLIILSSEPYPFKNEHIMELQNICPSAKITLENGEMFSWYGSRLLKASGYLKSFLQKI